MYSLSGKSLAFVSYLITAPANLPQNHRALRIRALTIVLINGLLGSLALSRRKSIWLSVYWSRMVGLMNSSHKFGFTGAVQDILQCMAPIKWRALIFMTVFFYLPFFSHNLLVRHFKSIF